MPIDYAKNVVVRPATAADAASVARLYNHFVEQTVVTFEEDALPAIEIVRRIQEVGTERLPWRVAELNSSVLGYAYATKWRTRQAYRFSAEVTVYVAPEYGRRGIGSRLYAELLPALRARDIHAAIGAIALPNKASVALHEGFGFKKVAHLEQVGFKFNRWIDVGYWQLIL